MSERLVIAERLRVKLESLARFWKRSCLSLNDARLCADLAINIEELYAAQMVLRQSHAVTFRRAKSKGHYRVCSEDGTVDYR
jgi:hypothetical protein